MHKEPSKPATGRFVVGVGHRPKPSLSVDFTKPARASLDIQQQVEMMKEGMLPLPDCWQHLTRERLNEMGYPVVKYHAKYKTRYLPLTKQKYDS